jgi:hypothetical protein
LGYLINEKPEEKAPYEELLGDAIDGSGVMFTEVQGLAQLVLLF